MVSVIIPMYNREKTIEMAVNSVLKQTYQNLEVIIVDDCSSDRSVEVASGILDERVRVITSEKNQGACVARNIGIDYANGAYIAFQDSDDFWHEDKLEKSLHYLEKEKADFVFTALCRVEKDKKKILPSYDLNKEPNKLTKLLCLNCVSTQTILAKKEVFEQVRFDARLPRFQDWDLAISVVKEGFSIYYVDEPLVDCFVGADSITSNSTKGVKTFQIFEEKYGDILKSDVSAREGFYYYYAYFTETTGGNGASLFKKAYDAKHNKKYLLRYLLAKVRLFRLVSKIAQS